MVVNRLNLVIAVTISALLAFAFWSYSGQLGMYIAVGSSIFIFGTLAPVFAISTGEARNDVNLRTLAICFFVIGLATNAGFCLVATGDVAYIVTSSVLFLLYLSLARTS